MHLLPEAVLWLLVEEVEQRDNLIKTAAAAGIEESRLVFSPLTSRKAHLLRYRLVDIGLDTVVYNGHTTTVDALSMGAPIVTLSGSSVVSRVAGSMLRAHGLPELVASTRQEFVAIAIHLAKDAGWRGTVRKRISQYGESRLFCPERRTRELETAYEMMWTRHLSGLSPQDFDIPAS